MASDARDRGRLIISATSWQIIINPFYFIIFLIFLFIVSLVFLPFIYNTRDFQYLANQLLIRY